LSLGTSAKMKALQTGSWQLISISKEGKGRSFALMKHSRGQQKWLSSSTQNTDSGNVKVKKEVIPRYSTGHTGALKVRSLR